MGDDVHVGGAVIPITVFSWDEGELSKIYNYRSFFDVLRLGRLVLVGWAGNIPIIY